MSWYNNVFTDKIPEKGGPIKIEELPRIPKDEDQEIDEILAKKTTDFDFVFSKKFVFSQMPTKEEDIKKFLNESNLREQNPANLQKTGFSAYTAPKTSIYNGVSSIGRAIGTGSSFVAKWTGLQALYNTYSNLRYGKNVVRGGGGGASRTQKRYKHKSKKTYRKILL